MSELKYKKSKTKRDVVQAFAFQFCHALPGRPAFMKLKKSKKCILLYVQISVKQGPSICFREPPNRAGCKLIYANMTKNLNDRFAGSRLDEPGRSTGLASFHVKGPLALMLYFHSV